MLLVDTHTHLFLSAFKQDFDQVIDRALANDVKKMILPNIDLTTIQDLNNTVSRYPDNLFPAIGIHPNYIGKDYQSELQQIEDLAKTGKYIAIGEIGIDLYREKVPQQIQIQVFEYQLELAKKLNLPVIIHTRNSFDLTLKIVQEHNSPELRGVFHCFTQTPEQAQKIRELGDFYVGIGGILTFKNSKLSEAVRDIPLEWILLETDSPFLTPEPYRGKRNESSYLIYIAQKLAQVKSVALEEVAQVTTANAVELFGLSV